VEDGGSSRSSIVRGHYSRLSVSLTRSSPLKKQSNQSNSVKSEIKAMRMHHNTHYTTHQSTSDSRRPEATGTGTSTIDDRPAQ
jgi:hypothetical protein